MAVDLRSFLHCNAWAPTISAQHVHVSQRPDHILQHRSEQQLRRNYGHAATRGGNFDATVLKPKPPRRVNSRVRSTALSKKELDDGQRIFSCKLRLSLQPRAKERVRLFCLAHTTAYNLALRWLQESVGSTTFNAHTLRTPHFFALHPIIVRQEELFAEHVKNPLLAGELLGVTQDVKTAGVRELLAKVKSTVESVLAKGGSEFVMRPLDPGRPCQSFRIPGTVRKPAVSWKVDKRTFWFYGRSFGLPVACRHRRDFKRWLELAEQSVYTREANAFECIVKYEQPGRYFLILPYVATVPVQPKAAAHPQDVSVVALDPGVRTFQTAYDTGGQVRKYGTALDAFTLFRLAVGTDRIKSRLARADGLQRTIDRAALQPGSALLTNNKKRRKFRKNERRRLRHRMQRNQQRVDGMRRDAHWRVAKDLCARYDHVLIPSFNTSQMVRRGARRIDSDTARRMMHWAHFQFRERLQHVALKTGVAVHVVSEAYTSKACGSCGRLHHKLGGDPEFRCPSWQCRYRSDRDAHGARNIMAMNVERCVGDVRWAMGGSGAESEAAAH